MSQIFYSEIDKNLQKELDARAGAGKTDRSETALRYMTEKIANVSITAYQGNKRDKDKIVHTLGGRNVIGEEYMPGGPNGFLTDRVYTLGESRWAVESTDTTFKEAKSRPVQVNTNFISNPVGLLIQDTSIRGDIQETTFVGATNRIETKTKTNTSKRIPPFITQATLQINDNSRATTNKVTLNITIPNPDRDLNFMESVYARPGRYCMVQFEHPDSALMTRNVSGVNGKLTESALPARDIIKQRFPEAESEYDELRKMNKVQFEGLITAFEYTYNQDGTVTMTVYILGTSQTYTDLSMIIQTAATGSSPNNNNGTTLGKASTFYAAIYDEVKSYYDVQRNPDEAEIDWAFGQSDTPYYNSPQWWIWNHTTLSGKRNNYINLNYLVNLVNRKILSKIESIVSQPLIYSDSNSNCYSNQYPTLVSNDPDNILLTSAGNEKYVTDGYGLISPNSVELDSIKPKQWLDRPVSAKSAKSAFYDPETEPYGRTGNIFINLEVINTIAKQFDSKPDDFTVGNFFKEISLQISNATAGAINLKLVTDPEDLTVLYYRDINWIKDTKTNPQPYLLPMFANDPRGTVARDFKLSAKLPSQVQSLMYSINSTDKVTESQLGPYINFMYNNGTSTRTPSKVINQNGELVTVDELTEYGGGKELTEKLAKQYAETHDKYYNELITARNEFGNDPNSVEKQLALKSALTKHLQYPFATIQQTNQVAAPTFPIEAEFTIDGINGLRYGDILDFPGLPAKYRTNSTFTIKSLTHTISNSGEWITQVSCLMRPKFD